MASPEGHARPSHEMPAATKHANNGLLSTDPDHSPETGSSRSADKSLGGDELPTSDEKEPVYITGIQKSMVLFAVTLAAGLLFLDTAIIATAIPRITDEFKSLSDVDWYGGAYQLGMAAFMPLTGKIYHHFSSKWSFLGFFGVFELGSVLCGAATSFAMLIVGRTIAGMGGSGIVSGALTIIASSIPLDKRAAATGIMLGLSQLGVVLGPLIGGVLTQKSTWRWCFYINLPLGAPCALFMIFCRIPDQIEKLSPLAILPRLHHHLDLVGFLLFAGSVVQLLLAFEFGGNQFPWNSSTVIGLFVGAVATFVVWCFWNGRRGSAALIPVSMVVKRAVWTSSLSQAFSMTTLFIVSYYFPIFFQSVYNASPITSGVQLLPAILGQLIFAILSGVLVPKTGFTIPYALVGTALQAIGSGLFSTLAPHSPLGLWFGSEVLAGVGRGLAMQMVNSSQEPYWAPLLIAALFTSILLVVGNTMLDESLRSEIPKHAPNVDLDKVVAAGATGYRSIVGADDLPGVVLAYANSLDKIFYIGVACASLAFLISPGMGWIDIRKKGPKAKDTAADDGEKNREVV
ncbi:Uu.00g056230.m01.CDS01 [Anthostomella pinea]|uniref:Uu.00g056230.m01.CDS01 n=1 Tax=Anthostomella pinea TaxID=933095 RepID=A0AAI8YLX9_9PEZI|nr:Uu.00g056230.m01.CDS01 [Anthostomella pinea]